MEATKGWGPLEQADGHPSRALPLALSLCLWRHGSASLARDVWQVRDYLAGLAGTCFYRVEGWWTYEFCYEKHLKQFHQENNVNTAEVLSRSLPLSRSLSPPLYLSVSLARSL